MPMDTINQISQIVDALTTLIPKLLQLGGVIVGGASVVASALPPSDKTGLLSTVHKTVNALAFNFGQAKNANTTEGQK